MSYLKLTNQTSCSKIGAGLGILLGGWQLGNNPILNVVLGLAGSVAGSRILLTTTKTEVTEKDFQNQTEIVKNHFGTINPVETNYNLYKVDPVGESPWFSWIKGFFLNSAKEDYENQFSSTKYFVHDYLRSTSNPYYLGLDTAPAVGGAVKFAMGVKDYSNFGSTCAEVGVVYALRPYLNYCLYQKGWLNDIESLDLECNQDEIQLFQEAMPEELYTEMTRVSV